MKRLIAVLAGLAVLGIIAFAVATNPATYRAVYGAKPASPANAANLENGRTLFFAGGCASCHATPGQDDPTKLGGGMALRTPFGTFFPPNISPDAKDGIGGWSPVQFVAAMREGISPEGSHYYPAFPYTSYQRMRDQDVVDLFAYLKTLQPVQGQAPAHKLDFPYSVRRGLGLWKLAFLDGKPIEPDPGRSAEWNRGRYLVEGPGHCVECHSPRSVAGNVDPARRFAGGPDPEGKGFVPNITPDKTGIGGWSKADIADLLKTGFTPDGDPIGGSMAPVVRNTAQLSDADRAAMAEYLLSLPPLASARPPKAPDS
jgi:mono/diheme cytochrome c family protein